MRALKTIYSRITTLDRAKDALSSVGVSVYDLQGQIKPVTQIINDLAGKFNTLTKEQQQFVLVEIAGRDQLSRAAALFSNNAMAISATATALDSAGSSMKEQIKFEQSLEARTNKLRNAWTELSVAVGDAILTDSIILTVEGLRDLAEFGTKVTETVGVLPVVLGGLSSALMILSGNFRKAVMDMTIFNAGLKGVAIAADTAKFALKGLLASSIVGVVFVGIGYAIEKIINSLGEYKKSLEDFEQSQQKNIDALTTQKSKTEELISSYKKLSQEKESGEWNTEKEQEYLKVQQELATIFPALVDHIDAQGNSHIINVDKIQQEIDKTKELIETKKEEIRLNAQDNIRGLIKDRNKIQNNISSKQERKEMFDNFAETTPDWFFGQKEEAEQESNFIKKEIHALESEYADASQRINDEVLKIADAFNEIEIDSSVKKEISDVISSIDFSQIEDEAQLENVAKNISAHMQDIQKAFDSGNQDAVNKSVESFNNFADKLNKNNPLVKDLKISVDELTKAQQTNAMIADESGETYDENAEATEGFSKELDTIYSKLSTVNQILEDYKENNSLSAESIDEILDVYPQLLAYVNDEEEMIKQLEVLRNQDAENAKQIMQQKIQDSTDFYDVNRQMIETHIKNLNLGYDVDLSNFKSLAEAKLGIEKQLIVNLAMAWKKYLQGRDIGNAWGTLGTFRKDGVYELTQAGRDYFVKGGRMDELTWLSQQQQTTNAQIKEMEDTINSISSVSADFNKIGLSSSGTKDKKSGSKSSSASKDEAKEIDLTEALINTANAEALKAKSTNESTKAQLDAISSQQKYREQIELTNKLISGQENEINKLTQANNKLHIEAQKVRAKTKYDTSKWFDDNLEASLSFQKLLASQRTGTQQEALQKLFDQLQKIKLAHRENSQSIIDLTKSTAEYRQELNNLQLTAMKSEYDAQLDDIDFLIEKQNILMDSMDENSSEYSSTVTEQNKLIQQKIALTEQEIQKTLDLMAVQEEDSLIKKELAERLEDLTIAQMQYGQQLKQQKSELANEIISIMKETYEKQKDLALDAIDEELDALEKSHDRKIEMLDEQNERIQESIDLKRKQIEQEESERDFTKQRTDLQKQLQELDNRIAIQDLDKSDESQAKVIEMQKERARIVEEIDELQHDRTIELRQQNLDELSDDFQKEYDQKKKVEDDKYNKERESIEKRKKLQEEYYDNLINDERKYAQVREEIMNGNLSNLQNQLGQFSEYIQQNMSSIGESISQNLIDKIAQAQEQLKNINSMSSSIPSSNSSSNNGSNNTSDQDNLPSGWIKSADGGLFYKDGSISYGVDKNGYIYKNGNFVPAENYKYIPQEVIDMAKKRKLGEYHIGGIVGGEGTKETKLLNSLFQVKPNEEIAKLLKGDEFVVNSKIAMPNFIDNMQNILSGFKPQIAGIPTGDNYEINLNIKEFSGTKKEAESTAKTIIDILKRRGK